MKKIIIAAISLVVLASCADQQPTTGPSRIVLAKVHDASLQARVKCSRLLHISGMYVKGDTIQDGTRGMMVVDSIAEIN
jgi:hypothetical protein